MSSINTNIGAYSAQQNLRTANAATVSSIGKLSSGNRIQRAADDVAGLSVGTILATNVNTLRTGLANAGQANSLLQVADGGLKNITNILQRQKALSVAATSGILSGAERGYLNQEFQNLTDEINRLVDNTKFNSVKLLDGSLSKQADLVTDVTLANAGTATAVASGTVVTFTAAQLNNEKLLINGVEITFTTSALGSADAAGKVVVGTGGTAVTQTAENVARYLNNLGDARLANFYFTTNTAGVVTAEWGGGLQDGAINLSSGAGTGGLTGATIPATVTVANGANDADGLGLSRTFAIGTVDTAGGFLASGGTEATLSGEAIDLSNIERTGQFTGKIGGENIGRFQVNYLGADSATFSIKVGNINYTSPAIADTTPPAAIAQITFTGRDENNILTGGSFDLNMSGGTTGGTLTSQADADLLADRLNEAFSGVTFVQNRDIESFTNGSIVSVNGTEVGQLNGFTANLRSDNFTSVKVGNVKIIAPSLSESDAKISLTVNGEEYVSYAGIGNKIRTNSVVALRNVNDASKALTFVTGNTALSGQANISIDLTSQVNADAVADALNTAFGVEEGSSNLNFQIGAASSDSIGIAIESAGTRSLFNGAILKLDTVDNANISSTVLDEAIGRVTALRANIGALQSRFDFASAQLETSIANVDAARSGFLDANISEESTLFAQNQVKLQASISVLSQANLLPQNLLKLLG